MQVIKYAFQQHGDDRGMLVALEEYKDIPFEIKRVYYMYDTKKDVHRGFHAHKSLEQIFMVPVRYCWITERKRRLSRWKNHMKVCILQITCGVKCMTFLRMQS